MTLRWAVAGTASVALLVGAVTLVSWSGVLNALGEIDPAFQTGHQESAKGDQPVNPGAAHIR